MLLNITLFGNRLQCVIPTTTSEVHTIILKCTNKSCDLDPFPKVLLTDSSYYNYYKYGNAGFCSLLYQAKYCQPSMELSS